MSTFHIFGEYGVKESFFFRGLNYIEKKLHIFNQHSFNILKNIQVCYINLKIYMSSFNLYDLLTKIQ